MRKVIICKTLFWYLFLVRLTSFHNDAFSTYILSHFSFLVFEYLNIYINFFMTAF